MKITILVFLITIIIIQIIIRIYIKHNPVYDITFIAAEIGAGKSCLSCKIASEHLKLRWNVYSNEYIKGCYKLRKSDIINGEIYPAKSLLIFDETGIEFNSRKFKTIEKDIIDYFKKCRHYKNKVVFISQTFTDTDKQLRDLSARIILIRKIIPNLLSMRVKVKAKIGIDSEGQPSMQYKIHKIGAFYYLPKWFKYFKSYELKESTVLSEKW